MEYGKIGRMLLSAGMFVSLLGAGRAACPEAQDARSVAMLTYNVRNGIGMDGCADCDRIARAIRRSGADVVAVQEVDSATRRSAGRYVAGEIAEAVGMHATFGAAIPFEGGSYGIAVLSRERPLAVRRIALPGREEARLLLVAEFDRYAFACVHLSLTEEDRLASVAAIRAEALRSGKPFVLAGDWNDTPGSPLFDALAEAGFRIVATPQATFPADAPTDTIDHFALFGAEGVAAQEVRVIAEPAASDHRPVSATLRWCGVRPVPDDADRVPPMR